MINWVPDDAIRTAQIDRLILNDKIPDTNFIFAIKLSTYPINLNKCMSTLLLVVHKICKIKFICWYQSSLANQNGSSNGINFNYHFQWF